MVSLADEDGDATTQELQAAASEADPFAELEAAFNSAPEPEPELKSSVAATAVVNEEPTAAVVVGAQQQRTPEAVDSKAAPGAMVWVRPRMLVFGDSLEQAKALAVPTANSASYTGLALPPVSTT